MKNLIAIIILLHIIKIGDGYKEGTEQVMFQAEPKSCKHMMLPHDVDPEEKSQYIEHYCQKFPQVEPHVKLCKKVTAIYFDHLQNFSKFMTSLTVKNELQEDRDARQIRMKITIDTFAEFLLENGLSAHYGITALLYLITVDDCYDLGTMVELFSSIDKSKYLMNFGYKKIKTRYSQFQFLNDGVLKCFDKYNGDATLTGDLMRYQKEKLTYMSVRQMHAFLKYVNFTWCTSDEVRGLVTFWRANYRESLDPSYDSTTILGSAYIDICFQNGSKQHMKYEHFEAIIASQNFLGVQALLNLRKFIKAFRPIAQHWMIHDDEKKPWQNKDVVKNSRYSFNFIYGFIRKANGRYDADKISFIALGLEAGFSEEELNSLVGVLGSRGFYYPKSQRLFLEALMNLDQVMKTRRGKLEGEAITKADNIWLKIDKKDFIEHLKELMNFIRTGTDIDEFLQNFTNLEILFYESGWDLQTYHYLLHLAAVYNEKLQIAELYKYLQHCVNVGNKLTGLNMFVPIKHGATRAWIPSEFEKMDFNISFIKPLIPVSPSDPNNYYRNQCREYDEETLTYLLKFKMNVPHRDKTDDDTSYYLKTVKEAAESDEKESIYEESDDGESSYIETDDGETTTPIITDDQRP